MNLSNVLSIMLWGVGAVIIFRVIIAPILEKLFGESKFFSEPGSFFEVLINISVILLGIGAQQIWKNPDILNIFSISGYDLPKKDSDASLLCYFSQMGHVKKQGRTGFGTADFIGPLNYFSMEAIISKLDRPPSYDEYSTVLNNRPLVEKYKSEIDSDDFEDIIAECAERFPLAANRDDVKLPTDATEAAALCHYVGNWANGVLSGRPREPFIGVDPIADKAEKLRHSVPLDDSLRSAIERKYNLQSQTDMQALNEKFLARSVEFGNLYSIVKACPLTARGEAIADFAKAVQLERGGAKSLDAAYMTQLYKSACNSGLVPNACVNLGAIRARNRDYRSAVPLYEKGCEGGSGDGCFRLAEMLLLGRGIEPNRARARDLYQRSCDLGGKNKEKGCDNARIVAGML